MNNFGERMKFYRKRLLLSQVDLARLMHCSQSAISHWEKNEREPSFDDIEKMSIILGCSVTDLTSGEKQKNDYIVYTESEKILIENYRKLSRDNQDIVFGLIERLKK